MAVFIIFFSHLLSVRFSVKEEKPPGTFVGQIPSTFSSATSVTYSFMDKPTKFPFEIGYSNGNIFTTQKINYETFCGSQEDQCIIKFFVLINSNNISLIMPIEVVIEDVNEYVPDFGKEQIELQVPECSPIGTSVELPLAVDLDNGRTGSLIEYRFIPEKIFSPFKLERIKSRHQTCRIYLRQIKPLKNLKSLTGYLLAFNKQNPLRRGKLKVKISVVDCEVFKPVFEENKNSVRIFENHTVGSQIARIGITDKKNAVFYKENFIKNDIKTREHFGVDKVSGSVFLRKSLDYETRKFYKFHIIAHKDEIIYSEANLDIFVENCNDNSPQIEVQGRNSGNLLTVRENKQAGTIVAKVTVTDSDEDDRGNISCEFRGPNVLSLGKIGKNEFYLATTKQINYEENTSVLFRLICSDNHLGGARETEKKLTLFIIDENDNPPKFEQSFYRGKIVENSPPNTFILSVRATDKDSGLNEKITYKINHKMFRISQKGDIFSNFPLDYEKRAEFEFSVFAFDQGPNPLFDSALVKIEVADVDDNRPEFAFEHSHFYLPENRPVGAFVGNIVAFDVDLICRALVYEILSEVPFTIDPGTGFMYSTKILDAESCTEYTFKVSVTDCGQKSAETLVTVHVEDVDDNPTVLNVYNNDHQKINNSIVVNLCQDLAGIGKATLEDADVGKKLNPIYELISDTSMFRIGEYTGIISLVDLEETNFSSRVTVLSKNGKNLYEKSFKVSVLMDRTCSVKSQKFFPHILAVVLIILCGFICFAVVVHKKKSTLRFFSKKRDHGGQEIASEFAPFYFSNQNPTELQKIEKINSNYSLIDNIKLTHGCRECDLVKTTADYIYINCYCSHNK